MILKQIIGKGAKAGHGLGKDLQGIQMEILLAPKRNRYGIGYQLGDQRRNGCMGSHKGNRMVRSSPSFPLLNWTFKLSGYINSNESEEDESLATPLLAFTINVITEDEKTIENICPTVYPCPPVFELNN